MKHVLHNVSKPLETGMIIQTLESNDTWIMKLHSMTKTKFNMSCYLHYELADLGTFSRDQMTRVFLV